MTRTPFYCIGNNFIVILLLLLLLPRSVRSESRFLKTILYCNNIFVLRSQTENPKNWQALAQKNDRKHITAKRHSRRRRCRRRRRRGLLEINTATAGRIRAE